MSGTDFRPPTMPESTCVCEESTLPTDPACSPVCRRTRAQVARRALISQQPLQSCNVVEIRSANAQHVSSSHTLDTFLAHMHDSIPSTASQNETIAMRESLPGICSANLVTNSFNADLDTAPNAISTAPNIPLSPDNAISSSIPGSLPNFALGSQPIICTDSLIVTIMMSELIDIVSSAPPDNTSTIEDYVYSPCDLFSISLSQDASSNQASNQDLHLKVSTQISSRKTQIIKQNSSHDKDHEEIYSGEADE
ncbi:hypothetical protein AVEN_11186-1, partial [Araneus ventricosus]